MPFYTYDNVPDSPINNFAVLNALNLKSNQVLLESNLRFQTFTTNDSDGATSTLSMPSSGKYYIEVVPHDNLDQFSRIIIGVTADPSKNTISGNNVGTSPDSYSWTARTGVDFAFVSAGNWFLKNGDAPTYTANAIYQIFYDSDNLKIWMGKNNNWYSSSGLISGTPNFSTDETMQVSADLHQKGMFFIIELASELGQVKRVTINFGQDPTFGGASTLPAGAGAFTPDNQIGSFAFQPPAGAMALCTANLPEGYIKLSQDQTPSDNFKAVTWTGDGSSSISVPVGFTPDLIWIKCRNIGYHHNLWDSVRGFAPNKYLISNGTWDEGGTDAQNVGHPELDPNDSSVFLAKAGSRVGVWTTGNGNTYVAWCWHAAGSPADNQAKIINQDDTQADTTCAALATAATNAGASNVITPSKVSANRQNGFSIVSYTGNNVNGATIPHGLNNPPEIIITKNGSITSEWPVAYVPTSISGYLNLPNSFATANFNDQFVTAPTSTVFSGGTIAGYVNSNGNNHIAYCWHSVAGYSKCGSYVGNGSPDGPFVYCGFRPAFVMVKSSTVATNWYIFDSGRGSKNPNTDVLFANTADNETSSTHDIDFVSNGFKVRQPAGYGGNNSNATYIFMAFSEQPFSGPSNAR